MNNLYKRSFLNALGTIAYIILIALVMSGLQKYASDQPDGFFAPVLALTMFVLSAAVTGSLVLGKPVLMYVSGEKKESIKLFIYTLCWLALFAAILLMKFVFFNQVVQI